MKVFVTGASGFIGAHVMQTLLAKGHELAALVRPSGHAARLHPIKHRFEAIEGTLEDADLLAAFLKVFRPDACIHLAWYAEPGLYLQSERNLQSLDASLGLFQSLIKTGCSQIVAAGTCFEYDTEFGNLREETPVRPANLYAAAKLSCFLLGREMAKQSGVRFAWGRIFYPYGPMEDERRLVPSAIKSLLQNKPFPASKGEQIRDYIHVLDVATAFCTLLENQANGVFNISTGIPVSVREVLTTIERLMDRPGLLDLGKLPPRNWEPPFICGENSRLKGLAWRPFFSLQDGLGNAIHYLQEMAVLR